MNKPYLRKRCLQIGLIALAGGLCLKYFTQIPESVADFTTGFGIGLTLVLVFMNKHYQRARSIK